MQEYGPSPKQMGLSKESPPPSFETAPNREQVRREFEADKLKINTLIRSLGDELTKDFPDTDRVGRDLNNLETFLHASQDALRMANALEPERDFFLHAQEEKAKLEQLWRTKQMRAAA